MKFGDDLLLTLYYFRQKNNNPFGTNDPLFLKCLPVLNRNCKRTLENIGNKKWVKAKPANIHMFKVTVETLEQDVKYIQS